MRVKLALVAITVDREGVRAVFEDRDKPAFEDSRMTVRLSKEEANKLIPGREYEWTCYL